MRCGKCGRFGIREAIERLFGEIFERVSRHKEDRRADVPGSQRDTGCKGVRSIDTGFEEHPEKDQAGLARGRERGQYGKVRVKGPRGFDVRELLQGQVLDP